MNLEMDIEILKAENDYLKSLLMVPEDEYPRILGLTKQESTILTYLRSARSILTIEDIQNKINSRGESNIVRVYICRLRKILQNYGVKIDNSRGIGYRIDFKNRKKLNELIAELLVKE